MRKYKVIFLTFAGVFLAGFFLNLSWEFAHAPLYVHYKGGEVTSLILFRAALFDAFVITVLAAPMFFIPYLRARLWLVLLPGIIFAVGLEMFALQTGRWEYTALMPLIPFINVGFTPTIQLGLTGWLALIFAKKYGARA